MVPTAVFLVSALSSNQGELVHFAPLQSTPLVNMRLASLEMSSGSSLSVRQHSTCQARITHEHSSFRGMRLNRLANRLRNVAR